MSLLSTLSVLRCRESDEPAHFQALEREIQEAVISYQKTYACPISLDLMVDPVIAAGAGVLFLNRSTIRDFFSHTEVWWLTDGHTYERKNILQHFAVRRARGAPVRCCLRAIS